MSLNSKNVGGFSFYPVPYTHPDEKLCSKGNRFQNIFFLLHSTELRPADPGRAVLTKKSILNSKIKKMFHLRFSPLLSTFFCWLREMGPKLPPGQDFKCFLHNFSSLLPSCKHLKCVSADKRSESLNKNYFRNVRDL